MIKKTVRVDESQVKFFEEEEHPFPDDFSKFTRTAINVYIRQLKENSLNKQSDANTSK